MARRMTLIPELRRAHRLWSVRLSALGGLAGLILEYMPDVESYLPKRWYIGLFLACMLARLISQEKKNG